MQDKLTDRDEEIIQFQWSVLQQPWTVEGPTETDEIEGRG